MTSTNIFVLDILGGIILIVLSFMTDYLFGFSGFLVTTRSSNSSRNDGVDISDANLSSNRSGESRKEGSATSILVVAIPDFGISEGSAVFADLRTFALLGRDEIDDFSAMVLS